MDRLGNKGVSFSRMIMGVSALFALTIIFIFFDPVIEDSIYAQGIDMVEADSMAERALNDFLWSWQRWSILFIIGIFLLIFTAGMESSTPRSRYNL